MQTNNLDDAERLFRKVIKLQPKWDTVQKNLANLRRRIEALDSEIESLRDEFHKHPDYLDIGLALGKSLFFRGYYSEAKTTFKGVLRKNPGLVTASFYLATIYELSEDTERAIEHYREIVLNNGKESAPEFLNFESLMKQEFYEEALNELKKIAILELDIAASRINLGIRYFEDCEWDDALRHFEEAVQINNTYPDAFYWTALALIQLEETAKAREMLEKALELNPDYADAHFQIGMLLRSKAKKKARAHFSKALSLNLRPSFARIAQQLVDEQK